MQVDGTLHKASNVSHIEKSLEESSITLTQSVMRNDITTQFPDPSAALSNVRTTEPVLTSNIVTQLSDVSDSIITSLSNSELNVTGNIASHGSIIITNDAIVFPPGTLMLSNQNDQENIGGQQSNPMPEEMEDDSGNENSEFDIKVEAVDNNSLKSNLAVYKVQQSQSGNTNSTFTMNHNVLQNLSDPVGEMQQISFNNGDHIAQFHIQMPLSISDIQNLQKINHNVFMSQAALPEDTKGLDGENIMIDRNAADIMVDNAIVDGNGEGIIVDRNAEDIIVDSEGKHEFLAATPSVSNSENKMAESVVADDSTVIVSDDNKEYLPPDGSFDADQHGNLFIKNENSNTPGNVIQGEEIVEGRVKCETSISRSSENQLVTNLPYQQIMYVQVDSNEPGGDHQVFPMTVSEGVNQNLQIALKPTNNTSNTHEQKTDVVKKKRGGRTRSKKAPYQTDKSNLRTLAPRLLSFPLYAGAQAAVGIGKSLLKPVNLGALQIIEGGQYFEVLGRCTQCFRFSRTTTYCRAEKNHRDPKSSVCMECEAVGLSTVVCRRKLNHSAPNAQPLNIVINTALQNTEHVKQLCIRNNLPPCFCELHSIVVHHADITFVGQRRCNAKSDIKSEMKYNIQEFGNTDLLSASGLTRNDDGEYGTSDISSAEVSRADNGEFTHNILSAAELTGKDGIELGDDANILTGTQKDNTGYSNNDMNSPQASRKPYLMKSELKYDDNEFDYNDFVSIPRVTRKPTDYARGYLYPYTKEKWAQWLLKFCYQTCTNFRIRTGKRVNKKLDHGLANHNGRIVPYRTLETQLYNCALGGRPRKRKAKDGIKKRKERGSKLIGCPAVIHTRLLETEYDWCALEVTAPKILAHLPFHDPRENNAEAMVEYDDILLSHNLPSKLPNNEEEVSDEQKFDFIHEVGDGDENLNGKKESSPLDVKKNTKSLLLTCASLTEMIDNSSFMLSIQEQSRDLLNKMHKEAMSNKHAISKKAKRKKFLSEQEQEVGEENIVIDKEQIVTADNLEQIEHIGMVNMIN